jgi:hypothetical protein
VDKTTLDNVYKIIRIISIVVGGVWVAIQYFAYKHEAQQHELTLAKLNIQSTTAEAALKELQLRYADAQLKLGQETQQIENKLKGGQLQLDESVFIDWATTLKVSKRVSNQYDATLGLKLTNRSKLQSVSLTYVLIEYFLRNVQRELGASGSPSIFRIAGPPSAFPEGHRSTEKWTRVGYEGHVLKAARASLSDEFKQIGDYHFEDGGAATGTWPPGRTADFELPYMIRADNADMVGFTVNMCLNCDTKSPKRHYDAQWDRLPK